eukprot:2516801-Prymnesium_polylepis.1
MLELVVAMIEAQKLPAEEAGRHAIELCKKYLSLSATSGVEARTMLAQEYPRQRAALAQHSFAAFANSQESALAVEEALGSADLSSIATQDEIIWSGY